MTNWTYQVVELTKPEFHAIAVLSRLENAVCTFNDIVSYWSQGVGPLEPIFHTNIVKPSRLQVWNRLLKGGLLVIGHSKGHNLDPLPEEQGDDDIPHLLIKHKSSHNVQVRAQIMVEIFEVEAKLSSTILAKVPKKVRNLAANLINICLLTFSYESNTWRCGKNV